MSNTNILYQEKSSWLETWDPRTKIIFALGISMIFIINDRLLLTCPLFVSLIVLWGVAKLSWKRLFLTIGSLTLLFLSTMVYHVLIQSSESEGNIVHWKNLSINLDGIHSGLSMCLQIIGIIVILSLLVLTTSPIVFAEGIEMLLKPLKKIGFPVHEGVMMLTIALRFLPILTNEFDKMKKAQIARGNGFHRQSLGKRIKGILSLLMPMFIQSIMRAEELATAMNARCYRGDHPEKTSLRTFHLTIIDICIITATLLLIILSIYLRYFL